MSIPAKKMMVYLLAFLLGGLLFLGCALRKKREPGSGVIIQPFSPLLFGYKTAAKIKTSPPELEKYLMDLRRSLSADTGFYKTKFFSEKSTEKVGDMIDITLDVAGLSIPGKITLIHYKPGEEIWYLLQGRYENMGILRFNLKEIENETKVSIKFETEEPKALVSLSELFDFRKFISSLVERGIAQAQVYFDPSLKVEELLEKGYRGETYDTFYQGYLVSIWINALPKEAVKRIIQQENLRKILEAGEIKGLAECLYEPENQQRWEADPEELIFCPVSLKLEDTEFKLDSFSSINLNDFNDFFSLYNVMADAIVFQLKLVGEEEAGGSRVQLILKVEPPSMDNPRLMECLTATSGLSQWMEQIVLKLKETIEESE